jgi:hypothetical protein
VPFLRGIPDDRLNVVSAKALASALRREVEADEAIRVDPPMPALWPKYVLD